MQWLSLLQLILSLLAAILLIGGAIVVAVAAAFRSSASATGAANATGSYMVAASLAFAGVLVLPSAWYAWQHIAYPEKVTTPPKRGKWFGLIFTIVTIILVVGALLLGNWSSQNNRLPWLLLPILNIIATGLPALWIIYIGTRGLIPGTPRRQWGVFTTGLVLGPLLILVLELFMLVIVGILAILWLMLNPTLANQLYGVAIRLESVGQDLNAVAKILIPLLLNPGVLFLGFAFISVIVPLLEEAFKPIGVWFLSGQKITPAQGFGYGVLSGAGFGLFENLGNTSGGGTDWAMVAATRTSTLMLHCFTAGLVGWALASAWSERRYLRLAVTYAIAVSIHGLWNGLAVLSAAPSLPSLTNLSMPPYVPIIGSLAALGVIILGALVLLLYLGSNIVLRHKSPVASPPMTSGTDLMEKGADQAGQPSSTTYEPAITDNQSVSDAEQQDQEKGYNPTEITGTDK